MAEQELTIPDPKRFAAEASGETRRQLDSSLKEALRKSDVPYGVHLETQTFYFGPEEPSEDAWEIMGDWVETESGPAIARFELLASRQVLVDGKTQTRTEGSVPGTGIDRDLLRKYGSKPQILKAITRAKKNAGAWLQTHSDPEQDLPPWGQILVQENEKARDARPAKGKPFDWWVDRADEYLVVAANLGTKYGVQAQLADRDAREDFWGVGIPGTRWRVRRLREMELIDDTGPIPRPGENHPRTTDQGYEQETPE